MIHSAMLPGLYVGQMPIKGRTSNGTGDFCQRIIGLVCVGVLHGARLGAWHVGHGAIAGDGLARAAVTLRRDFMP
jgi:hypothetical protein